MNKSIPCVLVKIAVVGVSFVVVSASSSAEGWPQFRGPNGQGVAADSRPPTKFGPTKNAVWRVPVSEGHSSPCAWADRLFITSHQQNVLACEAYDRLTGDVVWKRPIPVSEVEKTHRFSSPAAPTPVADAERVIAYFGSFGLICFNHEGVEQWRLPLPAPESRGHYGSASSPILVDGLVIQTIDSNGGKSRIIAVDKRSGEMKWETPRPLFSASWSTPVISRRDDRQDLIVLGSKQLVAYDPTSGQERWSASGFPREAVAVPAIGEGLIFAGGAGVGGRSDVKFEGMRWKDVVTFDENADGSLEESEIPKGYRAVQRPELPEGHPGRRLPWPLRSMLSGMDEDKDGEVTEQEWTSNLAKFESRDIPVLVALKTDLPTPVEKGRIVWSHKRGIPEIPSPLLYEGKVFLIRDGGLLQCLKADSGSLLYNERVGVSGGYCASPIAADGRVYLASHSGSIVVIDAQAEKLSILAKNELSEAITATPAIVGDYLYVRTAKHLYAFSERAEHSDDDLSARGNPRTTEPSLAARK